MDKVRITSDGTAEGTRLTVGDKDITKHVQSIEIGHIESRSIVTARVTFLQVEMDVKAEPIGGMMAVIIDGKEDLRPIDSRDVIILSDGTESGINRPLVYDGEQAVYYLDGQPPRIIKTLKG